MVCRVISGRQPGSGRRGPGRPVHADAARTRARILKAGYEVVNERGYAATTLQEIARRSGLSRPTLNYYFAGRDQLYCELLEHANKGLAACIAEAKRHDAALDQLQVFIDAVVAMWQREREIVRFLVNARLDVYRHPGLPTDTVVAARAFLGEVVARAVERRELLPHGSPDVLTDLLHSMLWGIGAYIGWQRHDADLSKIAGQLALLIGAGLPRPVDGDR